VGLPRCRDLGNHAGLRSRASRRDRHTATAKATHNQRRPFAETDYALRTRAWPPRTLPTTGLSPPEGPAPAILDRARQLRARPAELAGTRCSPKAQQPIARQRGRELSDGDVLAQTGVAGNIGYFEPTGTVPLIRPINGRTRRTRSPAALSHSTPSTKYWPSCTSRPSGRSR